MDRLSTQFLELEYSHLKPEKRRSSAHLKTLVAEDFLEIGSSGKLRRRSDFDFEDNVLNLDEFHIHSLEARPLAEDCVLTIYELENRTQNRRTMRSSIWKKDRDNWVLFFHQGTKK